MKVEEGARLRIQSSAQHLLNCPHDRLSAEKFGRNQATGAYLCTACGELLRTVDFSGQQELQDRSHDADKGYGDAEEI